MPADSRDRPKYRLHEADDGKHLYYADYNARVATFARGVPVPERERIVAALSASPARGEGDAPVEVDLTNRLVEMHKLAIAVCEAERDPTINRIAPLMALGDKAERLAHTLASAMLYVSYTHPTPATPAGEELREKVRHHIWDAVLSASVEVPDTFEERVKMRETITTNTVDAILAALQPQAGGGTG